MLRIQPPFIRIGILVKATFSILNITSTQRWFADSANAGRININWILMHSMYLEMTTNMCH